MSTLKNIQTRFGFWAYKNIAILLLITFFSMVFSLVYLLLMSTTKNHTTDFGGFLNSLPLFITIFLFVFLLDLDSKRRKRRKNSNYLISIDKAEKLRKKLNEEGLMTSEISTKLSVLVHETENEKDPTNLNAWMSNYRAWEKYQKALEEKRGLLEKSQKLPLEISEMEKNTKVLWDNLMW